MVWGVNVAIYGSPTERLILIGFSWSPDTGLPSRPALETGVRGGAGVWLFRRQSDMAVPDGGRVWGSTSNLTGENGPPGHAARFD